MKKEIFKIFNKGFTLIELLAVIVVLAVILAVAVPRIMSVIEESEKEALKLSAKNIEKAARDRLHMNTDFPKEDVNYLIIDGEFVGGSIPLSGNLPETGMILVRSNGDVGIALTDGKFCLIKNPEEDEMTITKDLDDCSFITEIASNCFLYEEVSDTEIVITDYDRYSCPLDVVIPRIIDGMTVVGIGNRAFNNKNWDSGDTTPSHKDNENVVAYNGQVGLNKDNLVAVMNIGEPSNERGRVSIRSVVFPDTIEFIGEAAFTYNLIKNVTIPENVEQIGDFAFLYNELTSITIPSNIKNIGRGAFSGNKLPDDQAFIYYRNQDGSIDNSRLLSYGGNKKDNIIIPSNVRIIEEFAFSDSQISSITIPNYIQEIKNFAFYNNNLKNINISNNIEIREKAISYTFGYSFNDHYNKLSGTYSATCQDCTWKHSTQDAPPIPTSCFEYRQIGSNEIIIDDYESNCPKDVIIPSKIEGTNVVAIGENAFRESNIISIILPHTIEEIDFYAFYHNQIKNIIIPSSVTKIEEGAFSNNQLTSVTIPSNVTYIGISAFSENEISNLTLNNGIEEIDDYAFSNNQLTSITIPSSISYIGIMAFYYNKLTSVIIPSTVTELGGGVFNNNFFPDGAVFIYARNSDGSIDNTKVVSYAGSKKADITIPNNVKIIGDYAFYGSNLENITIPNGVTNIGKYAFYINNIKNLIIPNSLTTIGESAFSYNQLTSLTIPNSVTSIGASAFLVNKLTSLTLSNNLTKLEKNAFYSNNLTSIVIPNSLTSLGYGVFYKNNITHVTIPSNVDVKYMYYGSNASISNSFYNSYMENYNQEGGVYTAPKQEGTWTKQP